MFYPYALTLVRRAEVIAALFALTAILMMPTRAPAMELRIVGNQLILSGPVVGDEPGKVREALASSPGIDTVILRNSGGGNAPAGYQGPLGTQGMQPLGSDTGTVIGGAPHHMVAARLSPTVSSME